MKDQTHARLVVLVRKTLTYERLTWYETDVNSMIVLKVKISKNQYVYIVCSYRQWNLLDNLKTDTSHTLPEQLIRLENIMKPIKDIRKTDHQLILMGDINIDLFESNDPMKRYDIRKLTELYKSVIDETGLSQLNFNATRYRAGCSPSLLDHFFTSHPNRADSVQTKRSIIADHWYVKADENF